MPLNNPQFLCRPHTRYPQLLKAVFNALIADGLRVDAPGDLAEQTTAQTGFYIHIEVWTARILLSNRGP
jgi:hypothetical protein